MMDISPILDDLISGNWQEFLFGYVGVSVSEAVFSVIVVAIVVLPTYARTQDMTLPAIALALLSGSFIPLLPGGLVGVAWGVLWLSGAVALFGLVQVFR
ncbi:hypothetical protein [Haloarchaeobius sp. DFWS5]|uniref:hypothetical protein n=1 Tax=Haloarchaeobius sp. DFWS5 TaxID=3446114 RepID=UPI003EC0E549